VAAFSTPTGVALAADESVYVTDSTGHAVRLLAASGMVTTLAGGSEAGFADGRGKAAKFHSPAAIVMGDDALYVSDYANHAIRKVAFDGTVTTLAGNGTLGFADGRGAAARFNYPQGITLDAQGDLFVADSGNARIRRIDKLGNVTTVAGGSASALIDGGPGEARLFGPIGLGFDPLGNLYFTDACAVRRMSPDGHIRSVSGSLTAGVFADGDPGTATFLLPAGLAVSNTGHQVIVTDSAAHAIRVLERVDVPPP
jgi:DNA-binding beta-propeller fold protein YncE